MLVAISRKLAGFFSLVACVVLFSEAAGAQTIKASVAGVVTDREPYCPRCGTPLPSVMQATPRPPQPQYRLQTAGGW